MMLKRLVSVLLVLCLAAGLVPPRALAANGSDPVPPVPFTDVSSSAWYYDAVRYVYENKIFGGTSDTRFTPDGTMTRGMFVTVLGRMAGVDATSTGPSAFSDVPRNAWYAPYVEWAARYGITSGTGNDTFSPDASISREQMAAFFVRYFEGFGVDYQTGANVATTPADMGEVADYAQEAVLKLWQAGLLNGDGASFNPSANASRAQAAALCMSTDKAVKIWYKEPGVPSKHVRTVPEAEPKPTASPGSNDSGDGDSSETAVTYYTFKFDTNDGTVISDRSLRKDSKLNNLPVPYKADSIFIGWCYDEALTRLVAAGDTAQESAILYAKYEEMSPLPQDFQTPVARAIDTSPDFAVTVSAPDSMDLDQFKDAVTLKNLSSNENKEWFSITGGSGAFAISGVNDLGVQGARQSGFVEGSAYKITLEDKALSFVGQDASAREYVFTIKRAEVVNVSLNAQMAQIPLADISGLTVNGIPATTVSIPVITVGPHGAPAENGTTTGSFIYSKGTLAAGDTIMIYEGDTPPQMDAVSSDNNTAFVRITQAEGSSYTYKTADAEDVLFTPDVLPVSIGADRDGDAGNHSITVDRADLTYTDDRFAHMGLDSQTTIDAGDFISFYSGTLQTDGTLADGGHMLGYARVTAVTEAEGSYTVAYTDVSLSELQQAMAAYKKETIRSDNLLEGVDRKAIESSVEQQARNSGFAEEAGRYLAALALETDSFTRLRDDYSLTAVEMTMDGQPITRETLQRMGGAKAEVELSKLQATLSTSLVHFEGIDGLRLTLDVGIKVKIECNDNVTIEIEIVGSFEQEVRVDIGVDGDAVWKWWGIFPYIAEYEVTAYVELYEYTGIGIEATIATKETEDEGFGTKNEEIEKIGKQIKDLMDQKEKYIGDGSGTVGDSLEEKYAAMLENESDWVTLFEKALVEQEQQVMLIIAINIEVKLVVSANLNISLGLDFWYENAKRYIYTVQVFAGNVTSDTIDLVEEHYEFEFYVMGTMGLRAGIKAEIKVGLFSTKLASVGFGAEAGAYVRVWGYFYYQLKYTASQGRNSAYSGALYLELGIYLEITFEAQALVGTFKYNPTLYGNEWPLLTAGSRDNVRNFAYGADAVPAIQLKSYITTTQLPDSLFEMAYLDLKEGLDEGKLFTAIYDDKTSFRIAMTNEAFSYDADSNYITVNPGGQPEQDGEMVITWITQPLAFSSAPLERRIPLHWDNLRDGYVIAPYSNGGSYVPVILKKYGEAVPAPADPVKAGYTFGGWHNNAQLTVPYTFPGTMPNADTDIYAAWSSASDTPYRVEHYKETSGSSQYALAEQEQLRGTTGTTVWPSARAYTGFRTPGQKELTIKPDGSSVLRYYYDLQTRTITFDPGIVGGDKVVNRLKYGSAITAPQFGAKGYIFKGWDRTVSTYMGEQDQTYTAQWEKDTGTEYRVEHYVQQPDGRYFLQDIVLKTGQTGERISTSALVNSRYVTEGETAFENATVNGRVSEAEPISSDGKTVIKVNYKRIRHTVTFEPANGGNPVTYTLYAGAAIVPPGATRVGYTFAGWSPEVPETLGATDLAFTARWEAAGGIAYSVKHIREDVDGAYPAAGKLVEWEFHTGITGEETQAAAKTYEGFTAGETAQERIRPDGSAVVEIRYARNSYSVHWAAGDMTITVPVKYEAVIAKPETPVKQGYVLDYWQGFAEGTLMGTGERTYTAVWKPAADTPYTVKHIREEVDGTYSSGGGLVESETLAGITGTSTAANAKAYSGFAPGEAVQATIQPDGSTVVEIRYARNTYAITWVADGQTFATTPSVKFGTAVPAKPEGTPVKAGYTFRQWKGVPDIMPAKGLTVTAEFTANTYTVTLDMACELPGVSITVTYDSPYGDALAAPERAGYHFERWVNAGGDTVTAASRVRTAEDHTLTAVWAVRTDTGYTVKHMKQDVEGHYPESLVEAEHKAGITGADTAAAAKDYAGFTASESVTQQAVKGDGSTVIEIRYTRNAYPLIWVADGKTLEAGSVKYGASLIAPEIPDKPGYRFVQWRNIQTSMPAEALTVTAEYAPCSYTVTFDANGGSGLTPSVTSVTYGRTYGTLPTGVVREGYAFAGWSLGESIINGASVVAIAADHTLTALWDPLDGIAYTVRHYKDWGDARGEELFLTEEKTGVAGDTTHAASTDCTGFTAQPIIQKTIDGSGTTWVSVVYTRNSYEVVWMAEGRPYQTTRVTYNDTVVPPASIPDKPGYYFAGWESYPPVMPANPITVEARFTALSYQVSFDKNGGFLANPNAMTVTYDQTYSELAYRIPFRAGYTFEGWQNGQGQIVTADSVVKTAGDHTLTAVWSLSKVTYTVEYYQQDLPVSAHTNTLVDQVSYDSYNSDIHVVKTQVPKYEYEGFSLNEISLNDEAKRIAFYYWRNYYALSYDSAGGVQGTGIMNLPYGTSINLFTPVRAGYTFQGWEPELPAVMPASDLSIVAQWQAEEDNVILLKGYSPEGDKIIYGTTDATLVLPTPYRTGFTFGGWYTQETGGERITALRVTGDITLYARWTGNPYQVGFELNGADGEAPGSRQVIFDLPYVLPDVSGVRTGYSFAGWFTADNGGTRVTADTPVSTPSDHILYAQWKPNEYRVEFNGNGATGGSMDAQSHIYDQRIALAGNAFVKTGGIFTGWNTQADGSGTAYSDAEQVMNLSAQEDITLYAQWALGQFTITFNSDGTAVPSITQAYGTAVAAPVPPAKTGYSFIGWKLEGTDGLYTFTTMPGDNITLTARWETVFYTIRYAYDTNLYLRDDYLPGYYSVLSDPIRLPELQYDKTGYTFAGWYTSDRFAEEDKAGVVAIPAGSSGDRTFYAKWTPNQIVVTFHSNRVPDETVQQLFTYDAAQPLASNSFANIGYSFAGWSVARDSAEIYRTDGQVVKNPAAQGEVHLYAIWKENISTISYSLNGVAASVDNPTLYHGTSGEIRLNAPTGIRGGFQFLGWYDSGGRMIESIQPGSTGAIQLTAKWAHGGLFSLSYVSTAYDNNGTGTSTYRVTRTIPSAAVITEDVQYVFYRTVNGTAIGGTAEAEHFKHVGGQAVFATFTSADGDGSYREFKVEGETATPSLRSGTAISDNALASAYTMGGNRYYSVELYKLTSARNLCAGIIHPEKRTVKRELAQNAEYRLAQSAIGAYKRIAETSNNRLEIKESSGGSSYTGTLAVGLSAQAFDPSRYNDNPSLGAYINATATGMGVQLRNLTATDGGWRMYRYVLFNHVEGNVSFDKNKNSTNLPNLPQASKYGMIYGINGDKDNRDAYTVTLPGAVGTLGASGTQYGVHVTSTLGALGGGSGDYYVPYGKDELCSITMGAYNSASADSYFYFNAGELWAKPLDQAKPNQIGVAPMAVGRYQAGDTISISVVYDEIVADRNNVTLGAIEGLNLSYAGYVGGEGTNVLHFVGTLSADYEVEEKVNEALVTCKPVSGAAKDMWGN
ncbi:InlB B-repeat-containing protein [Paenibacillus mesotrionivorans]|uniref:InlB B-repeat-containing protein n=1 Tax=Paenibacillus mesotrionivorans TaxID=3160968 RepID=A0ACC7NZR1_9BACL